VAWPWPEGCVTGISGNYLDDFFPLIAGQCHGTGKQTSKKQDRAGFGQTLSTSLSKLTLNEEIDFGRGNSIDFEPAT
jgi:hypothetical protein